MRILSLVASFLLVSGLQAQIVAPVPVPWPLGCPIPSTIENNTQTPFPYTLCTPFVTDANGQWVSIGICLFAELELAPGETVTTWWDQRDQNGAPVPPGLYFVNGVGYVVGAVELGLHPLGSPHVGHERHIELCATSGANVPYAVGASFSSQFGIPLGCGVHLPLDYDLLLVDSLTNAAVFPDFVGVLDGDGRSSAPAIVLPPLPFLIGVSFDLAFVTLDPGAPCGFGRTSAPMTVEIR